METKVKSFYIVLDRDEPVYSPGETVTGNCLIDLDGQMKLSQLTIKLEGKAECHWNKSEKVPHEANNSPVKIHAKEIYIDEVYHPGSGSSTILHTGQHNIGFSFQLPTRKLPSSFEGDLGRISYILEARIKKRADIKRQQPITIQSTTFVPLHQLNQGVEISKTKNIGWFGSKPVLIRCHLQKTGYNLATSISIYCFIDNQSKKSMSLRASLCQEVSYFVQDNFRKTENKIAQATRCNIHSNSQSTEVLSLLVPTNAPVIDQDSCRIIKVQYKVVVTLDIPGSFNLRCELPVILTSDSNKDLLVLDQNGSLQINRGLLNRINSLFV